MMQTVSPVLQELLLALVGHTGDVFLDDGDPHEVRNPNTVAFSVNEDLACISATEREVLSSLVKLGYHCRCIDNFVKVNSAYVDGNRGQYTKALARGVAEVLEVYKGAILKLQHFLLYDPDPPLSAIQYYLYEYQTLLPPVHFLVYEVHHRGLAGGQILQVLHAKAHSGIPLLHSCFSRLLWHCNQLLFRHLAAWVVHGVLLEQQGEFFVQRGAEPGTGGGRSEADDDSSSVTGALAALGGEWHDSFQLVEDQVPPYIALHTAQDVLFIGKAVRVLAHPAECGEGGQMPASDAVLFGEALFGLQQCSTFQQLEFERLVDWIKGKVAGHLWRLAVVQADLPRHLSALRDYYLLVKGDFWQSFLLKSKSMLALPPKPSTVDSELQLLLQQAALHSSAEQDPLFPRLRLLFRDGSDGSQRRLVSVGEAPQGGVGVQGPPRIATGAGGAQLDGRPVYVPAFDKWDGLGLDYRLEWPLHLLLNAETLHKYNVMFQYLLRLKRLQSALDDAWSSMRHFGVYSEQHRNRMVRLWGLRQHMAHMMSNLQIYVQVDVIEAQFGVLQDKLMQARDFSQAEAAHRSFIDALLLQSFLDLKQIMSLLEALISLCSRLCMLVQQQSLLGTHFEEEAMEHKLASLSSDFWRRAKMLYMALQSNKLQGSARAPFLRQFLLRLNYNGFMEQEVQKQQKLPEIVRATS